MKAILVKIYFFLVLMQQYWHLQITTVVITLTSYYFVHKTFKGSVALEVSQSKNARFCEKCNKTFPARSFHVYQINVCVSSLDHFCTLLDIEIGDQNFWYFFKFTASCTYLTMIVMFQNWFMLKQSSIFVLNFTVSLFAFPLSFLQLLNGINTISTGKLQIEEVLNEQYDKGISQNIRNFRNCQQIDWDNNQIQDYKLDWWLDNDYWSCF